MNKNSNNIEININDERAQRLGEAAMVLSFLKSHNDFAKNDGPQHLGIMDPEDKLRSLEDPRTISIEVNGDLIPIFVPIEYHIDANQAFFEGKDAYLFNWQDYNEGHERQLVDGLSKIPTGSRIMIEREATDTDADETLKQIVTQYNGRQIELAPEAIDPETDCIPNVIYYYSEIHRPETVKPVYDDISAAYEGLKDTDGWKTFAEKGVHFVSGEDIAPNLKDGKTTKLLEDLWVVYDETFNKLINKHPSDQKIPREYFDLLTTSVNSKVMYVENDGDIVSALFLVEDLGEIPWLNTEYFKGINLSNKTVFMPGIATKLDTTKAMMFSPRLIEAMSYISQYSKSVEGVATQCTHISARYIPKLSDRYTSGSVNLKMKEIKKYEYPVYLIKNLDG